MADSKGSEAVPMCFEFDRMFSTNASQSEIYAEMEEHVFGSLEGFNACLLANGQADSGKTYTVVCWVILKYHRMTGSETMQCQL